MRDAINASKSAAEMLPTPALAEDGTLHIFRAGTHRGSNGQAIDYSEQDVAGIADLYDPSAHEAPLVIGHPADNQPAFGWVQDLAADGADLRAVPHQVEENFAESVRKGRFKKISASFYPPKHPNHPIDHADTPYLRHVGFLGAQPPAVKGLDVPELGDDEDCVTVTFDLADMGAHREDPQTMLERLFRAFTPSMAADVDDPETVLQRIARTLQSALTGTDDASESGTHDFVEIDRSAVESALDGMVEDSDDMSRADVIDRIADEAGVEDTTINNVLRGDHGASLETIRAMNSVLDLNLSTEDAESRDNSEPTDSTDMADETEESTDTPELDELNERLSTLEDKLEATEEELEEERTARQAAERKAKRVDDLSEQEEKYRRQDIEQTVADAAENGQIHAKHRPLWTEVLDLAEQAEDELDTATIDLAEDDTRSLKETIVYLMEHQGPVVALGEIAGPEEDVDPVDFSDADSLAQAAKQEQGRVEEETGETIRFAEAMRNVLDRRDA